LVARGGSFLVPDTFGRTELEFSEQPTSPALLSPISRIKNGTAPQTSAGSRRQSCDWLRSSAHRHN
jgi:hypothetical protein